MSADDPDAALLARLAADEPGAARAMVAAKLPRIVALAERLLGDRGEAEDVAQEVFVRIWRQAPGWRPGAARFDTWIHTVALNLSRDRLRKRRETVTADPPDRADPAPLADTRLIAAEGTARVRAVLDRLPPRQREAVVLTYYQDLPNAEAAAVMEISIDALESLLSRGRRTLKALLMESHDDQ